MDFTQLKEAISGYLPEERIALVEKAYDFAAKAHQGQNRLSGEPYLEHPIKVALMLAQLQLDASTLAAALLHDVAENCGIPISEIESRFGPEVAKLVDATTKLGKLPLKTPEGVVAREPQAENLRKMLVAMAEDLRVVFIKLADRLHNMKTLDALPPEKQQNIARQTLDIYAPLAHRLGIWELKWQLEDLAFRYLEPERYREIARLISTRRTQRENFIARVIKVLSGELEKAGLKAEVSGRPKHIYSIYQKTQKYNDMGKSFNDIHDLVALRVLVDTVPDCYRALGVIHSQWHPITDAFDDFIANPKPNGYQSLHTAIMYEGKTPLEIQIRTHEMHHIAEYGVAAHWRYKQGNVGDAHFEERLGWMRQLIEWHRDLSGTEEFLESVKTDIFLDQVFVYTPKGEIKALPKGSTPLDFAYRVHTELGHRCTGAKVNGRLVPLNYHLNNGDVVEIIASKTAKAPSRDWLNPNLGYLVSSHAQEKVRQWFKKQERTDNIESGRAILEKEMRRLGIKLGNKEELAALFKFDNVDDFMAAIGFGGVSVHQIAAKLAAQQEQAQQPKPITGGATPAKSTASPVKIYGAGDMLTHLSGCCHPVPGDLIIGYVTRSRGISIHRQDCYNVIHGEEKERLVPAEWGESDALYPVNIQVDGWDKVGLMRDITTVVAEEKVNISSINLVNVGNHKVNMYFTLEIKGLTQLSRVLSKIERIRGVLGVLRLGDEATPQTSPKSK